MENNFEFLGKLKAHKSPIKSTQRLITSDKLGVVFDSDVNNFETDEQCEKILQLFACAPEMLEMLETIFEYLHNDQGYSLKNPNIKQLEEIIKKATE